jgi:hypothetical protein
MAHKGNKLKEPITATIIIGSGENQLVHTVPKFWSWVCDICGTEYVGKGEAQHCEYMHKHRDDLKNQIVRNEAERGWIGTNAVELHTISLRRAMPEQLRLDSYSVYEYDTDVEIGGPFIIKEEALAWIDIRKLKEIRF